ncbi:hypothetical protein [Allosalinactinospora lopnorensis]|uniref:hypothetical protein n=1 Tax=Allosalinactinospora lopnorensis TaxID=1352348 RepID=UPI0009E59776|nr:hypothetical protein [Allosalinactinospora lopnorensis]
MAGDVADREKAGREIAAKVRGLPDVAGLSSGPFGTLSMPVPGGRVEGVVLRDGSVRVGVVARFGRPLPEIAGDVRDAVLEVVPDHRVHVSIEDLVPDPTGMEARPMSMAAPYPA